MLRASARLWLFLLMLGSAAAAASADVFVADSRQGGANFAGRLIFDPACTERFSSG